MHAIEIKKARRPVLNPTKMKVQINGLYKDKRGNLWRAVDDLKFGRWLMRRDDRCVLAEMRTIDMQANGWEYAGHAA